MRTQELATLTAEQCRAQIADCEAMLSSLANTIRVTETNLDDRFYFGSVERLKKSIEAMQAQLDALVNSRVNAPRIIADARAQSAVLRRKIHLLRRHADIKRIVELQEQINELGG